MRSLLGGLSSFKLQVLVLKIVQILVKIVNSIASFPTAAAAEPLEETDGKEDELRWGSDYQEVREHEQETDDEDNPVHLRCLDGLSLLLFALDSSFSTAQDRSAKAL